jgi:DNA repair exonuclease SbcCD nuclease subunit
MISKNAQRILNMCRKHGHLTYVKSKGSHTIFIEGSDKVWLQTKTQDEMIEKLLQVVDEEEVSTINIKALKENIRREVNEITKEMKDRSPSRHILNAKIDNLKQLLVLLDNSSKANSSKILSSRGYDKVSEATQFIITYFK